MAGQAEVTGQLRQMIAALTGDSSALTVPADTPLLRDGIGLGSLAATMLLRQVRDRFGVDVADEDLNLDSLATLATLAVFITERTRPPG